MKLKTKFQDEDFDLGEAVEANLAATPDGHIKVQAVAKAGGRHTFYYDSLKAMCEEWEDYEKPDLFYYIDADGWIKSQLVDDRDFNNVRDGVENLIAIGNYFETEEEAEKAVEKLKARERLRRKGIRFTGYSLFAGRITFTFGGCYYGGEEDREIPMSDDLDLLFSGKDD